MNMIPVGKEYTPRCIRRTAGVIHRYEIGSDKFQVVDISSTNSPLCALVENGASLANGGTHYRIVGPDSTY